MLHVRRGIAALSIYRRRPQLRPHTTQASWIQSTRDAPPRCGRRARHAPSTAITRDTRCRAAQEGNRTTLHTTARGSPRTPQKCTSSSPCTKHRQRVANNVQNPSAPKSASPPLSQPGRPRQTVHHKSASRAQRAREASSAGASRECVLHVRCPCPGKPGPTPRGHPATRAGRPKAGCRPRRSDLGATRRAPSAHASARTMTATAAAASDARPC